MTARPDSLASIIDRKLDTAAYRQQHWEGTLYDYLDLVQQDSSVARNAFQRTYDMIVGFGVETTTQFKTEYKRYKFFSDPIGDGADAIYGLESKLVTLVDFFKSAAQGYGTEKRILLLHGPVGSSKSTIARLLKKGLEWYSHQEAGRLYTYAWKLPAKDGGEHWVDCPMHEDPLLLSPARPVTMCSARSTPSSPTAAASSSTTTSARSAAR